MSAAIDAIQAAMLARSATITDALIKAECDAFIAEYIAVRTAILALSSQQVTSYSLAGRSVTRADLGTLRGQANAIRAEIDACIEGNAVLVGDLSDTRVG